MKVKPIGPLSRVLEEYAAIGILDDLGKGGITAADMIDLLSTLDPGAKLYPRRLLPILIYNPGDTEPHAAIDIREGRITLLKDLRGKGARVGIH